MKNHLHSCGLVVPKTNLDAAFMAGQYNWQNSFSKIFKPTTTKKMKTMKNVSTVFQLARTGKPIGLLVLWLLALVATVPVLAQSGNATCNTLTPLTVTTFSNLTATSSKILGFDQFSNKGNVINSNLTDAATWTFLIAGSSYIEVKDNAATGANVYPVGSFAGFALADNALLSTFATTTVTTYLGNTQQESVSSSSLISVGLGSGISRAGFITTKTFDRVRISFNTIGAGTVRVYYAIVERFCAGPSVACGNNAIPANTLVNLTSPTSPVYIDGGRTGITNICALCGISNAHNVIDASATTPATIALGVGIANTANFAVANALDTYPTNSYAGFDVETNTILNVNVLGAATITLYNNGTAVQSGSGANLLVGAQSSLLTGSTRQVIGLVANQPYDEVQISFGQLASASLGTIKIYRAVFQKNCVNPAGTNCTTTGTFNLTRPAYGVVINAARTGVTGAVGVGTTVTDAENVISPSTTDFAVLGNIASAGTTTSISVQDAVDVFPAGTLAGFAIKVSTNIISASLLQAITVRTYLNGTLRETSSVGSLLNLTLLLNTSGPAGSSNVGFITTQSYNEIQLSVSPLVAAGLPTSIQVYGAVTDNRSLCGVTISGTIYDDGNGLTDNLVGTSGTGALNPVDGTNVGGSALYATLVNSSNVAVKTVPVTSTGTYSLIGVTSGNYSVILSTNSAGSTTASLPASYTNTGENIGTGAGSDGTPNGILAGVSVTVANVTDANFGIDQAPVGASTTIATQTNPGGTVQAPVSATAFTGTDLEDGTYPTNLTGRTVTLTPAVGGTLFYNGSPVSTTQVITGFDPTLVTLDPNATGATTGTGGASPDPTFTYQVADNAGVISAPATVTVPFTAPAPVSLISFTAQAQTDHSVLLKWSTSWERANKGYLIERSTGLLTFEVVGTVNDVAGSSNSINKYQFVDSSPYRGTSYYRLVQLDVDGSRHTYKAESVVVDGVYGVYPNPVSGAGFSVALDEPSTAKLSLFNASGQSIDFSHSSVGSGSVKVVPGSHLSSGVYVLMVEERGTRRSYRLVVQ